MTTDLDKALEARRALFLRDPTGGDAAVGLAAQLARIGDVSGAIQVLDVAIEANPSDVLREQLRALAGDARPPGAPTLRRLGVGADPKGSQEVACLAFDGAAQRLAVGTRGGDLWLHALRPAGADAAGALAPRRRGRVSRGVSAVAFTPDGATLVTGGADQTVRTWVVGDDSKAEVAGRGLGAAVLAVAAYRGATCGATADSAWVRDAAGVEATVDFELRATMAPSRRWCVQDEAAREARRFANTIEPIRMAGGSGPSVRTTFGALGSHAIEGTTNVSVVTEPTGSAVGLLVAGQLDVVLPEGPVASFRHPELFPAERTFQAALAVAALARDARAILIGSVDIDGGAPGWNPPYEDGARLFWLGPEVTVFSLLPDQTVTAVAFSPCGRAVALGCRDGAVFVGTLVW